MKNIYSSIFSEPSSFGNIPIDWTTLFEKDTDKTNDKDTNTQETNRDTKECRSDGITHAFCNLSGTGTLKILIKSNETECGISSKNDQAEGNDHCTRE